MKKLDWYIIRKFLGTFFFALGLIILIAIIIDISEKLDDFLRSHAPLKEIVVSYYLNFIPYFVNLFSHLFIFIAVIFFTSRMAYNTEVVAILSSGISFARFTRPYMIAAGVLAILSLLLLNFVIPKANKGRLAFEERYVRYQFRYTDLNIHRQIEPGTYIYLESYNNIDNLGYKFSMERIRNGVLTWKLNSEIMAWDSLKKCWRINHYYIRSIEGNRERLRMGATLDTTLAMQPKDFGRRINNIETMTYSELRRFIAQERMRGSDQIPYYLLEQYRRFSLPFATFVMALIGVSIASRKVRGGIGVHIGFGLLLSFSYIIFQKLADTFALQANLPPLLAVWIPNFIFGGIAAWLYHKAPK